jgi:hypothetical protein
MSPAIPGLMFAQVGAGSLQILLLAQPKWEPHNANTCPKPGNHSKYPRLLAVPTNPIPSGKTQIPQSQGKCMQTAQ